MLQMFKNEHYIKTRMMFILTILIISEVIVAQPDTVWTKTFGGANDDFGVSVQQTSDGGFIIAGETRYGGTVRGDIWLIKTDEFGDMLWTKTYGGSSRISRLHKDRTISVQETSDGGYILMAFTDARGSGGDDFWLIKTDTRGDTLWTKTHFILFFSYQSTPLSCNC